MQCFLFSYFSCLYYTSSCQLESWLSAVIVFVFVKRVMIILCVWSVGTDFKFSRIVSMVGYYIFTSDKGGGKCLSVRLLARLLKNACMDLDEMLRVDTCRGMDELINF